MIKAAFFDVDGTLLSFKTHEVPASTQRALAAMRKRGIKLFLATGRVFTMLPEAVNHGFDGYVTVNGQVCFDEAGEFRHQLIDPAGVAKIVDQVHAGLYDALVMTEEDSFISGKGPRVLHNEREVNVEYERGDIDRALTSHVLQMCAFVGAGDEHLVTDGNPYVVTARWCDDFCDVMPAGGGKPEGVRAMCERYGFTLEEAVAFGDGGNDISMLQAVGTGVAMGNASDNVKAAADYVTTDVDDDGIWNACAHLGLV